MGKGKGGTLEGGEGETTTRGEKGPSHIILFLCRNPHPGKREKSRAGLHSVAVGERVVEKYEVGEKGKPWQWGRSSETIPLSCNSPPTTLATVASLQRTAVQKRRERKR